MSFIRPQSVSHPRYSARSTPSHRPFQSSTHIKPETVERFKELLKDQRVEVQAYNPLPQLRVDNLNGNHTERDESNSMAEIDAAANDYYQQLLQRLAKQNNLAVVGNYKTPSSHGPVFRTGSIGASWRHVKQCTGNLGNHICFIDGVVKENDCRNFPPTGYSVGPNSAYQNVFERMPPVSLSSRTSANTTLRRATTSRSTVYQNHARNNFKYWYEPKKSNNKYTPTTIEGRIMKNGTAY